MTSYSGTFPAYSLEQIYFSEQTIIKQLLDTFKYYEQQPIIDRLTVTILLYYNNPKNIKFSDQKYINNSEFNKLYIISNNELLNKVQTYVDSNNSGLKDLIKPQEISRLEMLRFLIDVTLDPPVAVRMKGQLNDNSIREPIDKNVLYVGRNLNMGGWRLSKSKWHNPFKVSKYKNCSENERRQNSLNEYKAYILSKPELLKDLYQLAGFKLGCWCKPKICHADILVELFNIYYGNKQLKD